MTLVVWLYIVECLRTQILGPALVTTQQTGGACCQSGVIHHDQWEELSALAAATKQARY